MDVLDWDGAQVGINNSASWENLQESLISSNHNNSGASDFAIVGSKVGGVGSPQDIFNSIQVQLLQKSHKSAPMFQHSGSIFDQIPAFSSWNFSQDATRMTTTTTTTGATDFCVPLPVLNKNEFFILNHLNNTDSLVSDCGIANKSGKPAISAMTGGGSVESLDCLLSAGSNSNTDTSIEDDNNTNNNHEISMIFPDFKTSWNFKPMNTVSSGESAACDNLRNCELDETASQTSSGTFQKSGIKRTRETLLKAAAQNDKSSSEGGFQIISENPPKPKKPRSEKAVPASSNTINFQQPTSSAVSSGEPDSEAIAQMKEMIYQAATFRPVNFGCELMEKPKRKNVRISNDPQTVAARQRRERISERIRVLQRLVPGGSKMDTASMLDEAANYLKFLRSQVKALEAISHESGTSTRNCSDELVNYHPSIPFNHSFQMTSQFPLHNPSYVYLHHPKI